MQVRVKAIDVLIEQKASVKHGLPGTARRDTLDSKFLKKSPHNKYRGAVAYAEASIMVQWSQFIPKTN
jgi:hypothetical protein